MGEHGEGASVQAGQPVPLPQVQISSARLVIDIELKGALAGGAKELENHPESGF